MAVTPSPSRSGAPEERQVDRQSLLKKIVCCQWNPSVTLLPLAKSKEIDRERIVKRFGGGLLYPG